MVDSASHAIAPVLAVFHGVSAGVAAYSMAAVFLGYVVLGISGFGSALTIVPLLALHWPLATIVPLVLLLDVQSSVLLARLNVARLDWPELRALVPGMVMGAAIGALAARWTSQPAALVLLGAYVVAVAVRAMRGTVARRAADRRWAWAFGLMAGVVESAFGTAGPLVVAWLSQRIAQPENLRANAPAGIVAVTCCALAGMAATGQLFQPLVWASLIPLTLLAHAGTHLGHRMACRLPAAMLGKGVFALLTLSGLAMIYRGVQ